MSVVPATQETDHNTCITSAKGQWNFHMLFLYFTICKILYNILLIYYIYYVAAIWLNALTSFLLFRLLPQVKDYLWVLYTSMGTVVHETDRLTDWCSVSSDAGIVLDCFDENWVYPEGKPINLSDIRSSSQLQYGHELWVKWVCKCNWPEWVSYIVYT